MDGEFKYIHVAWIPAIPAEMTGFVKLMYNDEGLTTVVSIWKYLAGQHSPSHSLCPVSAYFRRHW